VSKQRCSAEKAAMRQPSRRRWSRNARCRLHACSCTTRIESHLLEVGHGVVCFNLATIKAAGAGRERGQALVSCCCRRLKPEQAAASNTKHSPATVFVICHSCCCCGELLRSSSRLPSAARTIWRRVWCCVICAFELMHCFGIGDSVLCNVERWALHASKKGCKTKLPLGRLRLLLCCFFGLPWWSPGPISVECLQRSQSSTSTSQLPHRRRCLHDAACFICPAACSHPPQFVGIVDHEAQALTHAIG